MVNSALSLSPSLPKYMCTCTYVARYVARYMTVPENLCAYVIMCRYGA